MPLITLEEHYLDPELATYFKMNASPMSEKLLDFDAIRIGDMDRSGIDMQVLSHAPPGLQRVEAAAAPALCARVNDRLAARVNANPNRFAAFAALPTTAGGQAAADELERCVTALGFKGGLLNGLTDGRFLDEPEYRPVFACAEKLDVPLYIHPADPDAEVTRRYFGDYVRTHPMFLRAAWGFTMETGTHAMRLVLSGLFEQHPGLKIILGHLGEAIPYLLTRIDEALSRDTPMKNFRKVFTTHFYVTTSGFFSDSALRLCLDEMGAERVLFSVDWPYAANNHATTWFREVSLTDEERELVAHQNARDILNLTLLKR